MFLPHLKRKRFYYRQKNTMAETFLLLCNQIGCKQTSKKTKALHVQMQKQIMLIIDKVLTPAEKVASSKCDSTAIVYCTG